MKNVGWRYGVGLLDLGSCFIDFLAAVRPGVYFDHGDVTHIARLYSVANEGKHIGNSQILDVHSFGKQGFHQKKQMLDILPLVFAKDHVLGKDYCPGQDDYCWGFSLHQHYLVLSSCLGSKVLLQLLALLLHIATCPFFGLELTHKGIPQRQIQTPFELFTDQYEFLLPSERITLYSCYRVCYSPKESCECGQCKIDEIVAIQFGVLQKWVEIALCCSNAVVHRFYLIVLDQLFPELQFLQLLCSIVLFVWLFVLGIGAPQRCPHASDGCICAQMFYGEVH